jgi:uncharacterized protein (TIRG00374 family)
MKIGVRYALALVAAALLVTFVDVQAVAEAIASADPLLVGLGILLGFASWALNTVKWQGLLRSRGIHARFVALYRLNLTGALYGTVLPGQVAGEAAKMLRLARMPSERATLVASVAADRVLGLVGLCFVGLVGVTLSDDVPQTMLVVIAAGTAVTLVATTIAFLGPRRRGDADAGMPDAIAKSPPRAARLVAGMKRLWAALAEFRDAPVAVALALLLSIAFQFLITLNVAVFAWSIQLDVGVTDMAWIMAVVAVVQLAPITVAAVGTRDVAFVVLLGSLGVSSAEAIALSTLVLLGNVAIAMAGVVSELVPDGELRSARTPIDSTARTIEPSPPH